METFYGLKALYAGKSPVADDFPSQRPVTRSFDAFFDLRLNKRLSKQSWGWCLETPSHSLWRHCNVFPVVWMFTSKSFFNKSEEIQRRALRFVLCDYDSCYENLQTAASVPGIRIDLLISPAIEDFKCVNWLNPDYLNKMIHKNRIHMSYATHPFVQT